MRIPQYTPGVIVDDVLPLAESDYRDGTHEYVDRFERESPFPVAFYQFGQVSLPGVSDLDLLVVCRDQDWNRAWHLARHVQVMSERLRYLFVHPPLVVCDSILPELPVVSGQELERLTPIKRWEPAAEATRTVMEEIDFMRHVAYTSRARLSWVTTDDGTVSLRHILSEMKNLLVNIEIGNSFLTDPLRIDIDAASVRELILGSDPAQKSDVCREYMKLTLDTLNEVDGSIDRELACDETRPVVFQAGNAFRCVAPLSASTRPRVRDVTPAWPRGWVISVPLYLVEATAAVVINAAKEIPGLRPIPLPMTAERLERYPGAQPFAMSLARAYRLSRKHAVPIDSWNTPFRILSAMGGIRARMGRVARRIAAAAAYGVTRSDQ